MPCVWRFCQCTGTLSMPSGSWSSRWCMSSEFDKIEAPAATAWPIVLAFGATLVFAGLVTAVSVSLLGAVLVVAGATGWFRDVLLAVSHDCLPVAEETSATVTMRQAVNR